MDITEELSDLRYSKITVAFYVYHEGGEVTVRDLVEDVKMSKRTARKALRSLEELGILEHTTGFGEGRRKIYLPDKEGFNEHFGEELFDVDRKRAWEKDG